MNTVGVVFLILIIILLASVVGWVLFTRWRAQRLGVSPATFLFCYHRDEDALLWQTILPSIARGSGRSTSSAISPRGPSSVPMRSAQN